MVNPRSSDRVREAHLLIEHVENDLGDARDDRRTAGRPDHHLEIAGAVEHDRGRHCGQHPLVAGNGVGFALHEPVHVRLARRRREVVHLVVQQESRARDRHAAPKSAIQRRGHRHRIALGVYNRVVRRVHRLAARGLGWRGRRVLRIDL